MRNHLFYSLKRGDFVSHYDLVIVFSLCFVAIALISLLLPAQIFSRPNGKPLEEGGSITIDSLMFKGFQIGRDNSVDLYVSTSFSPTYGPEEICHFWIEPEHEEWWANFPAEDSPVGLVLNQGEHIISLSICLAEERATMDNLVFKAAMVLSLPQDPADEYSQWVVVDRPPGITDKEAISLAERYLPILKLDNTTKTIPAVTPDVFVPKEIALMVDAGQIRKDDDVILENPTVSDLFSHSSSDYYLDVPDKNREGYFQSVEDNYNTVAYFTAMRDSALEITTIQFWFFYYFNDHYNEHEGDWEGVTIVFDESEEPLYVACSQHGKTSVRPWKEVERIDNHPVIYVANGSHASYFHSGETPVYDFHKGKGIWVVPSSVSVSHPQNLIEYWGNLGDPVILLPRLVDFAINTRWLKFSGRWGGSRWANPKGEDKGVDPGFGNPSPVGPPYQSKWLKPYGWAVDTASNLPQLFSLSQNYPNPFNARTQIKYALPRDCYVRLAIYNTLGQKVATLVDSHKKAGYETTRWDAGPRSSGIYFYRLKTSDFVQTRKMILLR